MRYGYAGLASPLSPPISSIPGSRLPVSGTAGQALEELLVANVRLRSRQSGTVGEQNDHIVSRHLGYLPEVLQSLVVKPGDLPMPPDR